MKKLALTIAVVAFGTFAMAQQTPEQTAKMEMKRAEMQTKRIAGQQARMDKMKAELNLNDAQMTRIRAKQNEMQTFRIAEMKNKNERNKESAARMKAQRMAMNTEMKSILSAEQYQKWEAQKSSQGQKMKDAKKMRNHRGGKEMRVKNS